MWATMFTTGLPHVSSSAIYRSCECSWDPEAGWQPDVLVVICYSGAYINIYTDLILKTYNAAQKAAISPKFILSS